MSRWKLGSMVRINGLFHLLITGVFLGVKSPTDPITFDPNFQRDIHSGLECQVASWLESSLFQASLRSVSGRALGTAKSIPYHSGLEITPKKINMEPGNDGFQ